MPSRMPIESRDWEVYAAVNARFAEAVAASWRPGDVVWIHDYQLLLVPNLLRRLVPEARIGFFLHIPFPPSDVFRVLPRREEVLDGLLGADVIGFQTFADQRNFLAAALRFPPALKVMAIGLFLQNLAFGSMIIPFNFLVTEHLKLTAQQAGTKAASATACSSR